MIKLYDYVIDADDNQYIVGILKKRKSKAKGEEEFVSDARYHTTLSNACRDVFERVKRKVVHEEELSATELVARITHMQQDFEKQLENVFGDGGQA